MADFSNPRLVRFNPALAISVPKEADTGKYSIVVCGPPGTGKSTLAGSMAETLGPERVLLLATLPREIDSWKYSSLKIPRILFEDEKWYPADKKFEATGFNNFLETLRYLKDEDDQYDGIICDSGTELAELAWHLALMPFSVGSTAEMGEGRNRFAPYDSLDGYLGQALRGLVALTTTAKRNKHVVITWHIQPAKEDTTEFSEGVKVKKESSDHAGEGVEYEGKILPMIKGRFRRRLAGQVGTLVYTDMSVKPKGLNNFDVQYRLQVRPDNERITKIPGPLPSMQYVESSFKNLIDLIQNQYKLASAPVAETPVAPTAGTSRFASRK